MKISWYLICVLFLCGIQIGLAILLDKSHQLTQRALHDLTESHKTTKVAIHEAKEWKRLAYKFEENSKGWERLYEDCNHKSKWISVNDNY